MQTGFLNRTVKVDGAHYRYVVYLPSDYDPHRTWPVILFLHGSGERGSDGLRQSEVGIGSAIRFNPRHFPAIVVMPQCPAEERWLDAPARAAMKALDASIAEFHGDRDRLYLTGLSLGGYGVWHFAMAYPDRFAAFVPVCGGIVRPPTASSVLQSPLNAAAADPYEFTARAVGRTPVWIFHGADDPIIPVGESRRMSDDLHQLGGDVRYTELPKVGHGAWDPAYANEELWTWLFAQHRTR